MKCTAAGAGGENVEVFFNFRLLILHRPITIESCKNGRLFPDLRGEYHSPETGGGADTAEGSRETGLAGSGAKSRKEV